MQLTLPQYKEILTVAIDQEFARLKGGFMFDDFDPAIYGHKSNKARLARLIRQKRIDKLEEMLADHIRRSQIIPDEKFAAVLLDQTGYKIEPDPDVHLSISTAQDLRIATSGKAEFSITAVAIELPTGSGSIYAIKGVHPELTANWLDDQTIEIRTPATADVFHRVDKVHTYGKAISIHYQEQ